MWRATIENCLVVFSANDCFRRINEGQKRKVINRALMDLVMKTMADRPTAHVEQCAEEFRECFADLLRDDEFQDLISRAIDHKSRTLRRFEIWNHRLVEQIF